MSIVKVILNLNNYKSLETAIERIQLIDVSFRFHLVREDFFIVFTKSCEHRLINF